MSGKQSDDALARAQATLAQTEELLAALSPGRSPFMRASLEAQRDKLREQVTALEGERTEGER